MALHDNTAMRKARLKKLGASDSGCKTLDDPSSSDVVFYLTISEPQKNSLSFCYIHNLWIIIHNTLSISLNYHEDQMRI